MDTPCLSGRSWGPAHLPRTFPSRLPGWLSSWSTSQGWGWREARPGLGRGRWESEDPTSLAARSYRTRATGRRVPSPLWGVIPPALSPELLSEKDRNTDSRESPSQRPPPSAPTETLGYVVSVCVFLASSRLSSSHGIGDWLRPQPSGRSGSRAGRREFKHHRGRSVVSGSGSEPPSLLPLLLND